MGTLRPRLWVGKERRFHTFHPAVIRAAESALCKTRAQAAKWGGFLGHPASDPGSLPRWGPGPGLVFWGWRGRWGQGRPGKKGSNFFFVLHSLGFCVSLYDKGSTSKKQLWKPMIQANPSLHFFKDKPYNLFCNYKNNKGTKWKIQKVKRIWKYEKKKHNY